MIWLEVHFWMVAQWLIRRGYGGPCDTSDLVDFPDMYKKPEDVFHPGRCVRCRAKEVVDWIDHHIELIRE
jgi:hypothetical protein